MRPTRPGNDYCGNGPPETEAPEVQRQFMTGLWLGVTVIATDAATGETFTGEVEALAAHTPALTLRVGPGQYGGDTGYRVLKDPVGIRAVEA